MNIHNPKSPSAPEARRALPRSLLALVATLGAALSSCETLETVLADLNKPTAAVSGVRFADLSLDGATLLVDVDVNNPYSMALPLLDLDYGLTSGGREVLSGSLADLEPIAASSSSTLTVPARVLFSDLLSLLSGVRPGALVPYEFTAALAVDAPAVGRIDFPLEQSGELPIPTVPEVELAGLEWDDLSFNEAAATLKLRIANTNAFAFDLSRLDYDLSLGGTSVARTGLAESAHIPEGGSRELAIPLSFSPGNLGLAFFKMLSGDGAEYEIGGTLAVDTPFGPLELPFAQQGSTAFSR